MKKIIFWLLGLSLLIAATISILSLKGSEMMGTSVYIVWIIGVGGLIWLFRVPLEKILRKNRISFLIAGLVLTVLQSLLCAYPNTFSPNNFSLFSNMIPDLFSFVPWLFAWFILTWLVRFKRIEIFAMVGLEGIFFEGVWMLWKNPWYAIYWLPNAFFYIVMIYPSVLSLNKQGRDLPKWLKYLIGFAIPIILGVAGVLLRESLGLPDYLMPQIWGG